MTRHTTNHATQQHAPLRAHWARDHTNQLICRWQADTPPTTSNTHNR